MLFFEPCLPDGDTGDAGTSVLLWFKGDITVLMRELELQDQTPAGWEQPSQILFGCCLVATCCNSWDFITRPVVLDGAIAVARHVISCLLLKHQDAQTVSSREAGVTIRRCL